MDEHDHGNTSRPRDDRGNTSQPRDDLTVALVAAVAENGVIGRDGELPWHYPEDLRRFKEVTMGHPVVMGRRTYESIVERLGEPLPGRTNVVLTSGELDTPGGVLRASSIREALDLASSTLDEDDSDGGEDDSGEGSPDERVVYVIGGTSVYEQFLDRADRLVLTEIHDSYDGDAYFPEVDWSAWEEVAREDREELSFLTYERTDRSSSGSVESGDGV